MRNLTEAEYQKLLKMGARAERFSDVIDKQKAKLDQLTDDLNAALVDGVLLERKIEIHRVVLNLVWSMWQANRRMIQILQHALVRRKSRSTKALVDDWLLEDGKQMIATLDWADEQVKVIVS